MKKAIYITEMSSKFGFGHYTRYLAMKTLLSKFELDLCLSSESDESSDSLPWTWCNYDNGWIDKINSHYSVIFIDSYHIEFSQIKTLQCQNKTILIDDFRRHYLDAGLIIDWTFNSKNIWKNLHPTINLDDEKLYFGEEYAVVRKEFLGDDINNLIERDVLTIFGGSDIRNFTAFFSSILNDSNFSYEQVITPMYPCYASHKDRPNVSIEASADRLNHLFRSSGLVISCGGQTLYELAVCNANVALVAAAKNQLDDIENFLQAQNGIRLDGNLNSKTIVAMIQSALRQRGSVSLKKDPAVGSRVSELQKGIYKYVG